MKTCTICKIEKPLADFNKKAERKDGLQTKCRDCSRLLMRQYYDKNKSYHREQIKKRKVVTVEKNRDFLFEYFKTHPCVDCGNSDIRVLEFDHLDPSTKINGIGRMIAIGHSLAFIKAEIAKCEVRCKNCHTIKTFERLGKTWHDKYILD